MTLYFLVLIAIIIYYKIIFINDTCKMCPNCHNKIESDFNVCPVCKETLKRKCNYCSKYVDVTWRYCPYCQFSLSEDLENLEYLEYLRSMLYKAIDNNNKEEINKISQMLDNEILKVMKEKRRQNSSNK